MLNFGAKASLYGNLTLAARELVFEWAGPDTIAVVHAALQRPGCPCEAQEEQGRPSRSRHSKAGVPKTFAGGVFQAIETGGPLPRETNVCSNRTISPHSLLHFCTRVNDRGGFNWLCLHPSL